MDKLSKAQQIELMKYNLNRMGENPKKFDLRAEVDSNLTFSENWNHLKDKYGLISRDDRRRRRRKYKAMLEDRRGRC